MAGWPAGPERPKAIQAVWGDLASLKLVIQLGGPCQAKSQLAGEALPGQKPAGQGPYQAKTHPA